MLSVEIAKNQTTQFANPWAVSKAFVYLGAVNVHHWNSEQAKTVTERLELYALESTDPNDVQFGARYGNNEEEYYSAGAGFWRDVTSKTRAGIAAKAWVNTKCGFEWSHGLTDGVLYV